MHAQLLGQLLLGIGAPHHRRKQHPLLTRAAQAAHLSGDKLGDTRGIFGAERAGLFQKRLVLLRKLFYLFFQAFRLVPPFLGQRGDGLLAEFLFVLARGFQLHQKAQPIRFDFGQLLTGGGGGVEVDAAPAQRGGHVRCESLIFQQHVHGLLTHVGVLPDVFHAGAQAFDGVFHQAIGAAAQLLAHDFIPLAAHLALHDMVHALRPGTGTHDLSARTGQRRA